MQLPEGMNVQGLALLGGLPGAEGEAVSLATRMFDTDGDGRNDLFVVDYDGDGEIDGAVRGLDTNGDGLSDTFVAYDGDGEITAVGRLDPASGEFGVVHEESDDFGDLVSSLGLADAPPPDEGLFTTFDDAFFVDSFGTPGEEVPDAGEDTGDFAPVQFSEVDEADLGALDTGAVIAEEGGTAAAPDSPSGSSDAPDSNEPGSSAAAGEDGSDSDLPEVTPRVVEIDDHSGAGDGSDLYAHVDRDGDGLADDEERLSKTSDGTWHGDIDKDGYSDEVAFDRDQDGRIEEVDTTGQGSSTDTVDAEQVVAPESEGIVDQGPGDDDASAGAEPADSGVDSGTSDDAGSSAGSSDAGSDSGSTTIDDDATGSGGGTDTD